MKATQKYLSKANPRWNGDTIMYPVKYLDLVIAFAGHRINPSKEPCNPNKTKQNKYIKWLIKGIAIHAYFEAQVSVPVFILQNNTDGANQGAGNSMPAFHQMIAGKLLYPLK